MDVSVIFISHSFGVRIFQPLKVDQNEGMNGSDERKSKTLLLCTARRFERLPAPGAKQVIADLQKKRALEQ